MVVDLGFAIVFLAAAIACASLTFAIRAVLPRRGSRGMGCHLSRRTEESTAPASTVTQHRSSDPDAAVAQVAREASARLSQSLRSLLPAQQPGAVPMWQQAVVAIGARNRRGAPRLVGSAFFVDGTARLLCTCCHVIEDIALLSRGGSSTDFLDPYASGIALGVGSPASWAYVAFVRAYSPPPAPRDERNGLDLAILQLVSPLPIEERRHAAAQLSQSHPALAAATPHAVQPPISIGPPPIAKPGTAIRRDRDESLTSASTNGALYSPASSITSSSTASEDSSSVSCELEAGPHEVVALPLGDESSLAVGDAVVLLGYGQAGRGGPPSATNTSGVFAGSCEHVTSGSWLRTDALMLSGHSGGPLLNRRGEVVGWSVRSGFDKVLNGEGYYAAGLNEVRPASALWPMLTEVLGGRPPSGEGMIPPGSRMLGAAETNEAVMTALSQAFASLERCSNSASPDPEASHMSTLRKGDTLCTRKSSCEDQRARKAAALAALPDDCAHRHPV